MTTKQFGFRLFEPKTLAEQKKSYLSSLKSAATRRANQVRLDRYNKNSYKIAVLRLDIRELEHKIRVQLDKSANKADKMFGPFWRSSETGKRVVHTVMEKDTAKLKARVVTLQEQLNPLLQEIESAVSEVNVAYAAAKSHCMLFGQRSRTTANKRS